MSDYTREEVNHYEARKMIAEYCRRVLPRLENKILNQFSPRELQNDGISLKKIKEEFFDYHRTKLTYQRASNIGFSEGTVAKSAFQSEDLVSILLSKGIIENIEDDTDHVHFDDSIMAECQLRERLDQIRDIKIDWPVLAIWRKSQNTSGIREELVLPVWRQSREGSEKERVVEGNSFLDYERIIFTGDSGVGKSRFLRELEKILVEEISKKEEAEYLPIYLQADDFNNKEYLVNLIEIKLKEAFQKHTTPVQDNKIAGLVRYLFKNKKIHPLIDAFDQINQVREANVFTILAEPELFGAGKCYITTRPYSKDVLITGIENRAGNADFHTIKLHPFDEDELKVFFKVEYPKVEPFIKQLEHKAENQVNVVRIPLLARLVKIMAIKGWLSYVKFKHGMTRTSLVQKFVEFIVEEQSKKDKRPVVTILEKEERYWGMIDKLKELSLKTLADGKIYSFPQKDARKILKEDYPIALWIEFICPFMDCENEVAYTREKIHRYQHQIFQEYFAAQRLYDLYEEGKTKEMEESLGSLTLKHKETGQPYFYMPEVGRFLAEMVVQGKTDPQGDFDYWQNLLMDSEIDDWARTYALHMRDELGKSKAKEILEDVFAEENQVLGIAGESSIYIPIPAGPFTYGSYLHGSDQPVRIVKLDKFEIARSPVTNRDYKRFIEAEGYNKREFWTPEGWEWREKEKIVEPSYWKDEKRNQPYCPVVGVSWYEAAAYCNWMTKIDKEGYVYHLPTEEKWEKAARGIKGRRYPWGNDFDKERCNTEESGISRSTPVNLDTYPIGRTTRVDRYPKGASPTLYPKIMRDFYVSMLYTFQHENTKSD